VSVQTIGVVDYGIGNHASVIHSFRDLDYRVRVSHDPTVLDAASVIVLPGVGAFPPAMAALYEHRLVAYLQEVARQGRPIIGLCLGAQLLTTGSHENGYTPGLDLIPGQVVALGTRHWHIGWNSMECVKQHPVLQQSDGDSFYFNHAYCYDGPKEFQAGITRGHREFASVIHRGSVWGLQFHPEKSQLSGSKLLRNLIKAVVRG
jgi:imidazole glycerol-phosphate synthase subunit HisH